MSPLHHDRAWRRAIALLAAGAAAGALSACAELQPYAEGECGNSVVDRDLFEQCDTHTVEAGQECGAPGSAGACRYVCAVIDADADETARYACPAGFSCGLDDLCHRAAGTFEPSARDTNLALGSRLGDFDGDGALDVLTSGLSRLDVSFFDTDGSIGSQQVIGGSPLVPPEVVELDAETDPDEERYDDAVFASGGDVVVALGSEVGLTPKSYAGIRLGLEAPTFFFLVPGGFGSLYAFDAPFVLVNREGGDGLRLVTLEDQTIADVVPEWPNDDVPTSVVTADYDTTSPGCHEVVLAYEDFLAAFRPCNAFGFIPVDGELDPPVTLELEDVPGVGKRRIVSPPALVELAGPEFGYEIVVEVNECADTEPDACDAIEQRPSECCHLYIGWSVPGVDPDPDDDEPPPFTGRFASTPDENGVLNTLGREAAVFTIDAEDEDGEPIDLAVHPLTWGDFNGDRIADFVTPGAAFVGAFVETDEEGTFGYEPFLAVVNQGFPWVSATVADFDADGSDDVVAVPLLTPALTYLRGGPAGTMSYATIQVERPYSEVRAGDLDGDGRIDIVGRTPSSDRTREDLGVLYFSDGGFAPARTIGSFPVDNRGTPETDDDRTSILQLVVGKTLSTFDSIDDVAAITAYPDEAAGEDRIGIALFEGRADRQLVAPITVIEDGATAEVASACVGRFANGLPTIVADTSQIDLDDNLEIRGSSRPIELLQPSALKNILPAGSEPGDDTLFDAANFDGMDDDDELMVAVPACEEVDCAEARKCCASGTETSRILLLDREGDDFAYSRFASAPLELAGLAGRAYSESFGLRLGRLRPTDLDGNGIAEALLLLGSREGGTLATRAYLVRIGPSGLVASPLPDEVTVGDATQRTNVFGFAITRDGQGAPLVLLATADGLFTTKVVVSGEGFEAELTFEPPVLVLGATGEPLAPLEVSAVEAGDVNGDGIDDLVLTRPFATEVYLGIESFEPPPGTP